MGIIYILENKIDGKCYVGQSNQKFNERLGDHKKRNSIIGNAIRKYGIDNFNKVVIENISEEKLDELEIEYIKKYNSLVPNGYNLDSGGNKNKHHHEITKKIISETSRNISNETRKKMSDAKKGKHPSKETRKKMSEAQKKIGNRPPSSFGNKYNLGRKPTEETRKKMSEAQKIAWMNRKKI